MLTISLLSLTNIAQIGIFSGIVLIIFGWVDKKEKFLDYGSYVFIALGLFAIWIIFSGQITVPEGNGTIDSKEAKALSVFKGMAICSGFALLSVILKALKSKYYRWAIIAFMLLALLLFFMVYRLQQQ